MVTGDPTSCSPPNGCGGAPGEMPRIQSGWSRGTPTGNLYWCRKTTYKGEFLTSSDITSMASMAWCCTDWIGLSATGQRDALSRAWYWIYWWTGVPVWGGEYRRDGIVSTWNTAKSGSVHLSMIPSERFSSLNQVMSVKQCHVYHPVDW